MELWTASVLLLHAHSTEEGRCWQLAVMMVGLLSGISLLVELPKLSLLMCIQFALSGLS